MPLITIERLRSALIWADETGARRTMNESLSILFAT